MRRSLFLFASSLVLTACSSPEKDAAPPVEEGTQIVMQLGSDLSQPESFYDFPYPSDLRLSSDGTPDLRGFPNEKKIPMIESLRGIAVERSGFPTMPVAYFRFTGKLAERDITEVVPASPSSPLLLIDIDPSSPDKGKLYPVVATTPPEDVYVPENLLAIAPRPGIVLHPNRTYAFVIQRSLGDADGRALAIPAALAKLQGGSAPEGPLGEAANDLYAPLWPTLASAGIDAGEVAAATIFTTGDVVADLADLSGRLLDDYQVEITGLAPHAEPGVEYDRFCRLNGKVVYPQFQKGLPPFDTEGVFEFGQDGLPKQQREEEAPIVLTLPKGEAMPEKGYPLTVYWHGSGGLSAQAVDRGPITEVDGENEPGKGPAYVLSPFGIATAASALPVNPERLEGAGELAYLNFNNLAAFRDTFRQGVIEQRLFLEALRTLEIPREIGEECGLPALPEGASSYRFDPDNFLGQGQSMGGMYTNMITAVEPRIQAAVPTGAGGYWSYFILETTLVPKAKALIGLLLGTTEPLTFMHPALHLLETAWEPAEPVVYMPRISRRPLPGYPLRPIYEPVGEEDSYFPTPVFDAVALAYGHKQAGDVVWDSMQTALSLQGLDGVIDYPVSQNLVSETGEPYTGVVVQYKTDGIADGHAIYSQLDAVKYQYGCFFSSFLKTGVATVPAPAPLGTPCP